MLKLNDILKNFDIKSRIALRNKEYVAKRSLKMLESYKSRLNKKVFAAPKIRINEAVTNEKARVAVISLKAHKHLNTQKGTKASFSVGCPWDSVEYRR